MIKVKANPPHSFVGIFSRPKLPPDSSEIKIKGKINNKKIIIYFLIFGAAKKAAATVNISIIKAILTLQIWSFGYSPYINLSNHTLIN